MGIGERSRREEVPPTNDETFAGPAGGIPHALDTVRASELRRLASVFQVEEPPEGVEEAMRGAGVALVPQARQR